MILRLKKMSFISCFLLFIFSCVTINIYFPEATVKKAAEEIVSEIRESEESKKEEKKIEEKISRELNSFSFIPIAYAQRETKVSNPKIRALKESLKSRFPKLRPFFDRGKIGEGNDGFIYVRNEIDLTLKERARLRSLVKDQNLDRKNIYAEVARALDIDPSQIPRVQKIFAENWIKKARSGWWIQKKDGKWIRKP